MPKSAVIFLLPVAAALLFGAGELPLLEDPNDGQYAEVGREMFEAGAWVSPTLNGVLFLNKPPFLYWLIELSYALFGVNEFAARVPGALATLLTVVLVARLGAVLFGERAGWFSACAYVAMTSIFAEARFVRPDTLLVASVVATLYGFTLFFSGDEREQRRGSIWIQVAVAIGVMSKGMVAILIPGIAILVTCLADRRPQFLLTFFRPRNWVWFVVLVAPWHTAAALRHEGFAWDYIVNQHLLFFLDKKLPRDSIPISLGEFWGAFLGRAYPWTLFLLPIAAQAARALTEERGRWRHVLAISWVAGTLLFFTANVSRLEHYALPALPGLALLAGRCLDSCASRKARHPGLISGGVLLLVVAVVGTRVAPWGLAQSGWLAQIEVMPAVARIALAMVGVSGLVTLWCAWRRIEALAPALAATSLCLVAPLQAGLMALAPYNSSKPVAELLKRSGADAAEIVFEAPTEYQHVAGLAFYLRRPVRLLRPPGFVDPDYLAPHSRELFLEREQLAFLWNSRPAFFVSDPLRELAIEAADVAPGRFETVGFVGNRWVLKNLVRAREAAPGPESPDVENSSRGGGAGPMNVSSATHFSPESGPTRVARFVN